MVGWLIASHHDHSLNSTVVECFYLKIEQFNVWKTVYFSRWESSRLQIWRTVFVFLMTKISASIPSLILVFVKWIHLRNVIPACCRMTLIEDETSWFDCWISSCCMLWSQWLVFSCCCLTYTSKSTTFFSYHILDCAMFLSSVLCSSDVRQYLR